MLTRDMGMTTTTTPATPLGRCTRILIVDDHEDAALLMRDFLEMLGGTIRVAYDGPSALHVAKDFGPEVALVDIGLPDMDGYELARRLREQARDPSFRVIAITGYARDLQREQAESVAFDAHLMKPVRAERLARLLRDLCEGLPSEADETGSRPVLGGP